MARTKSVDKVSPKPEDNNKPLLKEFIDHNQSITKYVDLILPHVPYTVRKMVLLHISKDKQTYKYRANYYRTIFESDCVAAQVNFIESQYVVVNIAQDGKHQVSIVKD